jgi:hypothetical protein
MRQIFGVLLFLLCEGAGTWAQQRNEPAKADEANAKEKQASPCGCPVGAPAAEYTVPHAGLYEYVPVPPNVQVIFPSTSDGISQAMAGASQSVAAAGMMKGSSKVVSTAMMANPMIGGAILAGRIFAAHHKPTVTDVWPVPGPKSETVINNPRPSFEVHYENIPGINADECEPVPLQLESAPNNFQLVGATGAKQDALQSSTPDWGIYSSFVEERVSAQATKTAPGRYQLQASSALHLAEYAVALCPLMKIGNFPKPA